MIYDEIDEALFNRRRNYVKWFVLTVAMALSGILMIALDPGVPK